MRALLLPVGDELYAIELTELRAVVAAPDLYAVPTAPGWLLGMFNLRGEVVPLLDAGAVLGVGQLASVGFSAVVDHRYGIVGLAAEGAPQTVVLGRQIGPPAIAGVVGSFAIDGDRVASLLDTDHILRPAA